MHLPLCVDKAGLPGATRLGDHHPQHFPAPKRMLCLGGGVPSHVGSPFLGTVSWVLVSSHTESFPLGPLVCFHCHGQRQAAGSESCIESQVNTSPCLFPLGEINK